MYRLELRIDVLPLMNTSNRRHRWEATKQRAKWALLMRAALGRKRKPKRPLWHARLTFTRHSSRQGDFGNLVESFKLAQDLLMIPSQRNPKGLGIIVDDGPRFVGTPDYLWEYAPRGKGFITIVVEEVEGAA